MDREHRGTIFLEDAELLAAREHEGRQITMRLAAPRIAARALPGSFVHVQCGPDLPMRRPLSLMRVDRAAGWIEVLFKILGHGLERLAETRPGQRVSVLGPVGRGFTLDPGRARPVLIGGGVGIPPLVFLAESLAAAGAGSASPVAFFGSELPFPFEVNRAPLALPGAPSEATASMALLDQLGIPSRLASGSPQAGVHAGFVTELAAAWLDRQSAADRAQMLVYACGPEPMLRAATALSRRHGLPVQVCLEEFMACAVGGCAGCTVPVHTPQGRSMKRVCVDGPVFDGEAIYPAHAA